MICDEALLDLADDLIRQLDELEGDADFEPYLGAPDRHGWRNELTDQRHWGEGDRRDLEDQPEDEGVPEYEGSLEYADPIDQRMTTDGFRF